VSGVRERERRVQEFIVFFFSFVLVGPVRTHALGIPARTWNMDMHSSSVELLEDE
jgi:hypothetical protein